MPPLMDTEIRRRIERALSCWNVTGYVNWKETARRWLEESLEGLTTRAVGELLYQHVTEGGRVDQVEETRAEWSEWEYHYDFRVRMGGRMIYIETRLDDDDPDDPVLLVVSVHDA